MPRERREPFEVAEPSVLLADVDHEGEGSFQLVLDAEDGEREVLASASGPLDWRVAVGVDPGTYAFEVVYADEYELDPVSVGPGDVVEPPVEAEREGYGVVGPVRLDGRAEVALEAATGGRVVARLLDLRGRPAAELVNEDGPYRGVRVLETEGVAFVYVQVEGKWVLRVAETDVEPPG